MNKAFIPLSNNQVLVTDPSYKAWESDILSAFRYLLPGVEDLATSYDEYKDSDRKYAIFYNLYGFTYTEELVQRLKEATTYPLVNLSSFTKIEFEAQVRGTALALQRGMVPTSELAYFIGTNTNYRADMYILYNKSVDWAYVPFTHHDNWAEGIILNDKEVSKYAKQTHITHDYVRYFRDSRAFLDCLLLSKAVSICGRDFDLTSSLSDLLPTFHKFVTHQGIDKINVSSFGTQEDLVRANDPKGSINTLPIFALYYRGELHRDTLKPTQHLSKLVGFKPIPTFYHRGKRVDLHKISILDQVKMGYQAYLKSAGL